MDCGIQRKDQYSSLKFEAGVAACLCNERKVLRKRGRLSNNADGDLAEERHSGPTSPAPSPSVHQDNTGHWPIWVEKKGWCKYPG
ncbi:hypothetical protein GJAV_G00010310 [Gymnothorax javanicus]|nr:hypothetical protein GJAV_G00010310 [Gymnothorax javanicus]